MKHITLSSKTQLAGMIFVGLVSNQNYAQPSLENETVPELVVTGTILSGDLALESVPRTSLDLEDIIALQPITVADLLQTIPGIDVTRQGGEGGLTFVSMRGGDPNFTVVMIDGIKVDDPTNSRGGGFDFTGLDPLMIERIDVYFGSYSAIYGSDALGGAISVTTRNVTTSFTGSGTLEISTDDAVTAALHVSGPLTNSFGASASVVARKGGDAVKGDSMDRQQLTVRLASTRPSENAVDWSAQLFISNADATSFPIASGGDQLAVIRDIENRDFDQTVLGGQVGWSPADWLRTEFRGGWIQYEETNDSPGIAPGVLSGVPPVITKSDYERANLLFTGTATLMSPLIVGFGAEFAREEGGITSLIDFGFPILANFSQTRDTWALFGEAALSVGERYTLITSLRHDDVESISSTNVRATAKVDFDRQGSSVSFTYAQGFKLPSLFAIGHPLTGNPNLQHEESESLSINIQHPFWEQKGNLYVTLYRNEFTNLVDFDSQIFSHVNRAAATTEGVDVNVEIDLGDQFRISGRVSYLDTELSDGSKLEHRPKWKAGLTLGWEPSEVWLVTINGYAKDDYYSVAVPTGVTLLDGYSHIDARIRRRLSETMDLSLLVSNVFDKVYEQAVGFSTPGRQVRLAFTGRF